MKTVIFAGKGGVGKTLSAVSLGIFLAGRGEKTVIIDYDGGHSVRNTLGIREIIPINSICEVYPNLSVAVIEHPEYRNITRAKQDGMDLDHYLKQFPGDLGIIPFVDMLYEFFGVPIDIPTLQKFVTLVTFLCALEKNAFANVIIDVEPTAGLEKLLMKADSLMRSMRNLKDKGILFLTLIGVRWPDIRGYIRSEYMSAIDRYSDNIKSAVQVMKSAIYLLVCIPEFGPVNQMFQTRMIIEKFCAKTYGFVVNNVRGEDHEEANIALLRDHGLPVAIIRRRNQIHVPDAAVRIPVLLEIGEVLCESFIQL